eukprot:1180543-Prorocentrum_minimum.AAC.3
MYAFGGGACERTFEARARHVYQHVDDGRAVGPGALVILEGFVWLSSPRADVCGAVGWGGVGGAGSRCATSRRI